MADVGAKVGAAGTTSALLIGSAIFKQRESSEGGASSGGVKRAKKKRGIKEIRGKKGKKREDHIKWARGDLENMYELMIRKNIAVYDPKGDDSEEDDDATHHENGIHIGDDGTRWYNYKEQRTDNSYALGKIDILRKIEEFFDQKDKTLFVLYYTGHGNEDGSWVFPVTRTTSASPVRAPNEGQGESGGEGATAQAATPHGAAVPPLQQGASYSTVVIAEVHEESGSTPGRDVQPQIQSSLISQGQLSAHGSTEIFRRTRSNTATKLAALEAESKRDRPPPHRKLNDCVTFEDIVDLWDEKKAERGDRNQCRLLMILDCCFAGKWVQKVKGDNEVWTENGGDAIANEFKRRRDICIQAACHPSETSTVSDNQRGSIFTKAFVAAQSKRLPEKYILTLLDHFLVLNFVCIASSPPFKDQFTPMSSSHAQFGDFHLFDSFDDMRT